MSTAPIAEWLGLRLAYAIAHAKKYPQSYVIDYRNEGGSEAHLTGLLTEFGADNPNALAKEHLA